MKIKSWDIVLAVALMILALVLIVITGHANTWKQVQQYVLSTQGSIMEPPSPDPACPLIDHTAEKKGVHEIRERLF